MDNILGPVNGKVKKLSANIEDNRRTNNNSISSIASVGGGIVSQQQQLSSHHHQQSVAIVSSSSINSSSNSNNNNTVTTFTIGGHETAALVDPKTFSIANTSQSQFISQQYLTQQSSNGQQRANGGGSLANHLIAISMDGGANLGIAAAAANEEMQSLGRENQKLITIARLSIHLIDRCRNLNKAKQFTEDLFKLSSLIEEYNRSTTRRGSLPLFNNNGIVFQQTPSNIGVYSQPQQQQQQPQQQQSSQLPNQSTLVQAASNNMFLVPVHSTTGGGASGSAVSQHQPQQIFIDASTLSFGGGVIASKTVKKPKPRKKQPSGIGGTILEVDGSTLGIPLNNIDPNLFSLVNQIDGVNIENVSGISGNKGQNSANSSTSNDTGSNSKAFECLICKKPFANSYNLNRHMKSHSGYQPYVCNIGGCQKRFNYSYHLRRHMETHSGERPYICTWPDCGQSFNRKYNLHRHVMGVHAEKMKTTAT